MIYGTENLIKKIKIIKITNRQKIRSKPESNRRIRICSPLHGHSAIQPTIIVYLFIKKSHSLFPIFTEFSS